MEAPTSFSRWDYLSRLWILTVVSLEVGMVLGDLFTAMSEFAVRHQDLFPTPYDVVKESFGVFVAAGAVFGLLMRKFNQSLFLAVSLALGSGQTLGIYLISPSLSKVALFAGAGFFLVLNISFWGHKFFRQLFPKEA